MQRLIDANKLIYKRCDDSATRATFDFVYEDDIEDAETVLTIPDNATNGDMIKALFPSCTIRVITESRIGVTFVDNQDEIIWAFADWWNAPYKRGEE